MDRLKEQRAATLELEFSHLEVEFCKFVRGESDKVGKNRCKIKFHTISNKKFAPIRVMSEKLCLF
jgi:hypothetical protein